MKRFWTSIICILTCAGLSACLPSPNIATTAPTAPPQTAAPTRMHTPAATSTPVPTTAPTPLGGSGLVYTNGDRDDGKGNWVPGIYRYDLSAQQTSLVIEGLYIEGFAPDGKHMLAFQQAGKMTSYNTPGNLFITDLDGSNPVLVSATFAHANNDTGTSACWYPNANVIVFRGFDDHQHVQLFTVKPDGSGLTQLTQSTLDVLNFLPTLGNGGIYWDEGNYTLDYGWNWVSLDGQQANATHWQDMAISPNGAYIVYWKMVTDQAGTNHAIYEISRTDGQSDIPLNLVGLLNLTAGNFNMTISSFLWFPDNQRLLMQYCVGDKCNTYSHMILSVNGESLGEVDLDYIYGNSGAWSPDRKYYGFMDVVQKGNDQVDVLKVLDVTTMQVRELNLSYPDVPSFYKFFWKPGVNESKS